MNLQVRFGIIGAILGLLVGLIGGIAAGVPFGIILARSLLALILAGAAGFAISFAIKKFLPELIQGETAENHDAPQSGSRVDITLDDENEDQAQALREEVGEQRSMFEESDSDGQDSGLMEEVSENPGRQSVRFDEDAFYQGVEQLPDIGGFSEQFQSDDHAAGVAMDSGSSRMDDPSAKTDSSGSNMNPALVAQAIRTALKKEDH